MGLSERLGCIKRIEELRGSRVLTYITGDRQPVGAAIGDDAVRPMYDHLREVGQVEKLDLFLYSRGGAIDVPWRIVTALRRVTEELSVLIPFRANSAATLLALGADTIILGGAGELGPIDPIMHRQRVMPGGQGLLQDDVAVEDVMSYVKFVTERAGLSDQNALSVSLGKLAERLDPVALGSVYRTHSHIRDVARRMLLQRKAPASEQDMASIIETLAERVYAHGHAIGMKDAKDIGLPVEQAEGDLDEAMWALLGQYEADLRLLDPIDPAVAVASQDTYSEADSIIAAIESTWGSHEFTGEVSIKAQRQMPQALTVNLNLSLQLPANMNAQQLPQQAQQLLQGLLQQAQQNMLQGAQQAVQDALKAEAPLASIEAGFRGGRWKFSSA